jgi:hypothetical protein
MTTNDQAEASGVPVELSKDDLLKYVEIDLWERFQERLWKVVGIGLTVITIIGFLGVPYYIKNEMNNALRQQALDFRQRTDAILSQAKLLSVLTTRYNSERSRFDTDVYRLIEAIGKFRAESKGEAPKYRSYAPEDELTQLISRSDFSRVVDGSAPMAIELFSVPNDLRGKTLMPPTVYIDERMGLQGAGGYRENHPVRDGAYEGAIRDLRFRMVALEALRRAIASSQDGLLALGGVTEIEKRVETVRVKSLESTEFSDSMRKEVASIADSFLNDEEKAEFARFQSLYLEGELPLYQAPNTALQGPRDKVVRP